MVRQMAIIKAYHAGGTDEIEKFLLGSLYIKQSYNDNNWLGNGLYFWENDSRRAENWQIQKGKGSILECEIDTGDLLNLLEDNDEAAGFFANARSLSDRHRATHSNNKATQRFALDCKIFNVLKADFQTRFAGVRMAFYLGESASENGNLYTDQHIQVCLWDLSVIQNPKKYIPCEW